MTDNPLLQIQFAAPFDAIRAEHVVPAITILLERARADLRSIAEAQGPRTYANTIAALDRAIEPLDWAMGLVGHLESVATDDALRTAYNEVQPQVAAFYAEIPLDAGLWRAIQGYAASAEVPQLDPAQRRHVEKIVADFRRQGADLDAAGKQRLAALEVELAQKTTTFSQNVLDSTQRYALLLEDPADLAGLPASAIEAARRSAEAKGCSGWRFTLQAPSYLPVLTYLDHAGIREAMYRAHNTRATETAYDNRPLLREILRLRAEKARLLGFAHFADLVLEDRMAESGDEARRFIAELRAKTLPAFEREQAELLAFRRELEGPDAPPLAPWDVAYYAEKQRRARYDFDEEALRPYFAAEHVLQGLFDIVERLYGVVVRRNATMPTWHPAVQVFDAYDADGSSLGAFYVDIHPRESKRDGAWMHGLVTGEVTPSGGTTPHLALICANVTPPLGDAPAMLTHREVETLFHEFGHLMHHLLSRVGVKSLGGTNVAWDFVELPSQIMENWCWEREALDLFARHHETGATIPEAVFEGLRRARTFRAASAMMRQLGFATVDLALHMTDPEATADPVEVARAIAEQHSPTPLFPEYAMIAGFTHLFAHPVGYAAGYYSYKWAEVLEADAFTRFREHGIFSREVGSAFRRQVLAPGGTADPMALYTSFMGRPPRVEPLLERCGLLESAP